MASKKDILARIVKLETFINNDVWPHLRPSSKADRAVERISEKIVELFPTGELYGFIPDED